jgi:hypothetical protein
VKEYGHWAIRRVRRTYWLLSRGETRPDMARYLYEHSSYAVRNSSRRFVRALSSPRSPGRAE